MKPIRINNFAKDSITLLSAGAIGQGIVLLTYPFLTHLYAPAEFGALSLFLSIVGIVIIISTGQYESAIMIEQNDEDAKSVFGIAFLSMVIFNALGTVAILFFAPYFKTQLTSVGIYDFLLLIPLLAFLSVVGYLLSFWSNRIRNFNNTASYNLVQNLSSSALKIIFGLAKYLHFGLILSTVIAQCVGISVVFLRRGNIYLHLFSWKLNQLKFFAKKHKDFPLYTLPHRLLNVLSYNLPTFVFATFFDMKSVGFFALSITIGQKTTMLIARALHQVYFQRICSKKHNVLQIFSHFVRKSFAVGFPIILLVYCFLPSIITPIFGNEWIVSSEMLQRMLPWLLASFMAYVFNFLPAVTQKQKLALGWEIIGLFIQIIALTIGIFYDDILVAILALSVLNTIFYAAQMVWYAFLAKKISIQKNN